MNSKPPYYRIYLLTVWQEQGRGPPAQGTWRFRLEDPRTGRQQVFADAAALMAILAAIANHPDEATTQKGEEMSS